MSGAQRTRTRIRRNGVTYHDGYNLYTKSGSANILDAPPYDHTLETYYERIHDEVGVRNRQSIKPVYHFKVYGYYGLGNGGFSWASAGGYTGTSNIFAYVDPHNVDTMYLPTLSGGDLALYSRTAYDEFSTQFPSHVDLFNFLRELPEIGDLAEAIARLMTKLLDSKTLRNGFLAYNFGLKPLLSDIKLLQTVVPRVLNRLEWLKKNRGKPVKLNFYRAKEVDTPFSYPSSAPSPQVVCVHYSAQFRAHAVLRQELEGLDTVIGTVRSFASSLGLLNPAKIIWNAIPYSFIVDWLFKVSDLLNSLDIQPLKGKWELSQVHHTIKEIGVIERYNQIWPSLGNPWRKTDTGVVAMRYRRAPGLPVLTSELSIGDLSPQQQALLAALLDQRLRR